LKGDTISAENWLLETKRRNQSFSNQNAISLVPTSHREFAMPTKRSGTALGL
jgi:hypothetical protein